MGRSRESRGRSSSSGSYGDSRGGDSRGGSKGGDFRGGSKRGRNSDRSSDGRSRRFSRTGRNLEMTKVTCNSCGDACEVPFKPTSNKPVFCRDCFEKDGKEIRGKQSNKDFDVINEKLDKIMDSLGIE